MIKIDLKQYGLDTSWAGQNFMLFDELESTNDYIKQHLSRMKSGQIISARYQEKGKGRNGNIWHGEKDTALLFSILIKRGLNSKQASKTVFITAIALHAAINEIYDVKTKIKWPNDIFIKDKKVAGILTEMYEHSLIIGVGINVNQKSFPDEIKDIANSLYLSTNHGENIFVVLSLFLNYFEKYFELYLEQGFLEMREKILENFYLKDKTVSIQSGNDLFKGVVRGMNEQGELELETQNRVIYIPAGEVHVCL